MQGGTNMLDNSYIEDKYILNEAGKPIYWIKDDNIYKIEDGDNEFFIKENYIYTIEGECRYSIKENYIYRI